MSTEKFYQIKPLADQPAFPCPAGHLECYHPDGVSVRTYIATAALQGMLVSNHQLHPDVVAKESVAYADALIAQLEKK